MLHKCHTCKHLKIHWNRFEAKCTCKLDQADLSGITNENLDSFEIECGGFKSKYIEFPLTVSAIELPKEGAIVPGLYSSRVGSLVRVRPCGEEYQNKTYLGILLGEADIGPIIRHHPDTNVLTIERMYNPAMFVPDLKTVIYGSESWWGEVDSEEELSEITDQVISDQWYVKLLRETVKEESSIEHEDL